MEFRAHPFTRLITSVGVVAAFGVIRSIEILTFLSFMFIALGCLLGMLLSQLRVLRTAILPIFFILSLVWGVLLQTPPGGSLGSNPIGGLLHAALLCMRLSLISLALQVLWMSVDSRDIPSFLNAAGIRGRLLVGVLAFFGVFQIVVQNVASVVIALQIRGKIRPNRILSRLSAIPEVLLNIWAPALTLAIARVEAKWGPQDFLEIACIRPPKYEHRVSHDILAFITLVVTATMGVLDRVWLR